ncbi:hypothetical protein [Bacillus kwashiorkori]|uniref:hypothetical protein n=1 Tax=Bacillus kwashiorkori TaxID=1522318 RepID=UPI000784D936|nr:hypothetical protein [Bacillus kwashiorkori]
MNLENKLISKQYYQSLVRDFKENHPIQSLGELFLLEQKKEMPDASYIRFSQGEVYYQNKDYEAAIYKWENVHNELKPWAQKNIGDAYFELELYPTAEKIYTEINTESIPLQMEIQLQLFALYIEQHNSDAAKQAIKKAVSINPDYPNVTKIAKKHFEKTLDWESAMNLAISEGIRTQSLYWFELIKSYVKQKKVYEMQPDYFHEVLTVLFKLDKSLFEQLVIALWNYFKNEAAYFPWLVGFNRLFISLEVDSSTKWNYLPDQYAQSYKELMSGNHLLNEMKVVIPGFLNTWLLLSNKETAILPCANIFAWNEVIPQFIAPEMLQEAEKLIFQSNNYIDINTETEKLYVQIISWKQQQRLEVNGQLNRLSNHILNENKNYITLISMIGSEKSVFVNSLFNRNILPEVPTSAVTMFQYGEKNSITEYKDNQFLEISDVADYHSFVAARRRSTAASYDVKLNHPHLKEFELVLIDTPDLYGNIELMNDFADFLHISDGIAILLYKEHPISNEEWQLLEKLKSEYGHIPLYFILVNMDDLYEQQREREMVEIGKKNIEVNYSDATIFAYFDTESHRKSLLKLLQESKKKDVYNKAEKYVFFIKRIIADLLVQRKQAENQLLELINQKEDLLHRVIGAKNQLTDLQKDKIAMIKKSYHLVAEEMQNEIIQRLPKVLQTMAETIDEERDFFKINQELNDEMNEKITQFIENIILPEFESRMNDWLKLSEQELEESRKFFEEMAYSLHSLIGENQLEAEFDFNILNDWQRDINRLTRKVEIAKANILLRYTPSQIFLKSTGRVLSVFSQNKATLVKKYQSFIENENYEEVVKSIAHQFVQPFTLIEQGIERDVDIFFEDAYEKLIQLSNDTEKEISETKATLMKLKENPESFEDPLSIFEILRTQFEIILKVIKPDPITI